MIPADPYRNLGPATILRADARDLPLADNSVDLIVTSPPYFALRSYQDTCRACLELERTHDDPREAFPDWAEHTRKFHHYAGQLGSEATPAEFVDALIECTREMVRVVKPSGSIWINLGDKYSQYEGARKGHGRNVGGGERSERGMPLSLPVSAPDQWGIQPKSLCGIPWRFALRCIDDLGLILRAEVIWSKCLSGGTIVYARTKGRVQAIKLHDLCRHYQPGEVELWTGEKWSRVRAWESTARGDEQYEIELRTGERIGCTAEHRWPTWRGLVRSDELQVGDLIDTAPLPDGETTPAALDDEMVGWFVGLYIAEGSRSEQTIQIAGHVKELERFKRLSEVAQAFHGTAKAHATGGNTATINMTGPMLRAILDTYVGGRTAKDKHLAPKCWQRSNRFLRAVLDGYLSGDGHWREDAHRWIVKFTNNDALASDLRTLGARLGLSVRLNRCTHTGFGKEWPGWRGNITEPARRRKPDNEIVAIRASRARQFWDLAIEDEPHLFTLASGVLTHNSNGLPESVTDRVRRSHEQWFHFTLQPRYFSAVDEIREPHAEWTLKAYEYERRAGRYNRKVNTNRVDEGNAADYAHANPLGKLPGSVWTIPTQPLVVPDYLGVDHFAAFPSEWPKRIIRGWSPAGVCTACGEGRRPVVDKRLTNVWHDKPPQTTKFAGQKDAHMNGRLADGDRMMQTYGSTEATITGYVCACPEPTAPTTPAVILDPFGGTGTVAMVARALGRHGIHADLSADYNRLARWRITDLDQLAAVQGHERTKREPDTDDLLTLLDDGGAA